MSMRGTSRIPGLAHLCQLYHRLLSDSDLRYSTHPPRATCLPLEHDLRLETRAGPVQHWSLEIDPIHLHLGGHLPSARLVNGRRGLGPHHRCRLLSTWPGDQCKGDAPWASARSADHREVL